MTRGRIMGRGIGLLAVAALLVLAIVWMTVPTRRSDPKAVRESRMQDASAGALEPILASPPTPPTAAAGTRETLERLPLTSPGSAKRERRARRPRDAMLIVRTVAADSGRPLADVNIAVLDPVSRSASVRRTDASGSVEYPVLSRLPLELHADGLEPFVARSETIRIEPMTPAERRTVVVRLTVGGLRYFGRVVDRASGVPVEDALVGLRDEAGWTAEDVAQTRTGPSGQFEWVVSERRELELHVEADGFASAWGRVTRGHDSPAREHVFGLWRTATIRGRVIDGHGSPLEGILLWAGCEVEQLQVIPERRSGPLRPQSDPGVSARTDEAGTFELVGLPPRVRIELMAFEEERRSRTWSRELALAPAEVHAIEIVLHEKVTLAGKVLDQRGQPVARLELWMTSAREQPPEPIFFRGYLGEEPDHRCRTAADGSFRFEPSLPGPYHVGPAPARARRQTPGNLPVRARAAPVATYVELPPGPALQDRVLRVERGRFIQGRVVGPGGRIVKDGVVRVWSPEFGWLPTALLGDDGSFAAGPLPNGVHTLRAASRDVQSDAVEASAGATDVLLRLNLPRLAAQRICGRVESTSPPRGAKVFLFDRAREFDYRVEDVGTNGHFEFRGLEPGLYDVVASTEEGTSGWVSGVSPSPRCETRIPVILEECAYVRVTPLGDPQWTNVRALRDGITVAMARAVRSGTSAVLRVPPGGLVLELVALDPRTWRPTGDVLTREVRALPGEECEISAP